MKTTRLAKTVALSAAESELVLRVTGETQGRGMK